MNKLIVHQFLVIGIRRKTRQIEQVVNISSIKLEDWQINRFSLQKSSRFGLSMNRAGERDRQ